MGSLPYVPGDICTTFIPQFPKITSAQEKKFGIMLNDYVRQIFYLKAYCRDIKK